MASGRAGRTRLRSAGAPQSDGRGHPSVEGGQADERRIAPVTLTGQLADVELPPCAHRRGAGVPDVGVVLPHHDLRGSDLASRWAIRASSVPAMCRSRRFHDDTSARYIWW